MHATSFQPRGFSILKFLLGIVLFLVVTVLVFITFLLSPTAKWAANTQLPEILGTDASVSDIKIGFWTGDLEIRGVEIADPADESGEGKLFLLESLRIDLVPTSVFSDTLHIREIAVSGPEAHIQRLADGSFSFEKLKIFETEAEQPTEESKTEDREGGKAIRIDKITLEGIGGSFKDASDPTKKTFYNLRNFAFTSSGITVNPESAVDPLSPGVALDSVKLSNAEVEYFITALEGSSPGPIEPEDTAAESEAPPEDRADGEASAEESPDPTASPTDPVFIGAFEIENFSFHYKDEPVDGEPIDLQVVKFYTRANDVVFDPSAVLPDDQDKILTAELGFQVQQSEKDASPASFVGVAKSTVIGDGLPVTAGQVQLTGLELATLGPIVPKGTQTAIGGSGFDLSLRWFVSPDKLDGKAIVVSNKGTRTSLTLSGTPDKPEISGSEMLMNVMGRPLNLVQNLAGNAIGGGIEIVSGAADAAGKLAKGAGDTVLGFGKGLLNTGKGLLKGDLKEAGKGLEEATVGTVTTAGTAVADSTGAATSGVQGAVSAGTGGARQISWREENQTRHEAFESAAKEWLESGTFPPDPTKIAPEKTPERKEPVSDERGDEDGQRAAEAVNEG